MYDLTSIPRQSNDAVARELGGGAECVILHIGSGQYHSVNETGAYIWSLIDGEHSIEALAEAVRARFSNAPGDVAGLVVGFVEDLRARDLVT